MKINSVRTKLILIVIIIGMVVGTVFGLFSYNYLKNILASDALENNKKIIVEQVHESTVIYQQYQLFSKMLGTRTRVREYLQLLTKERKNELNEIFMEYAKNDKHILSIYLIDDTGNTLISTDETFVGKNYAFREYFKQSISGKPYVDAAVGVTSNRFGYYFSHPVLSSKGNVIGVLVVKISDEVFNSPVEESEFITGGTMMVTDSMGVILFSNREERILQSLGPLTENEKKELEESNHFLKKEIKYLQYSEVRDLILNYTGPKTIEIIDSVDNDVESFYVQKIGDFPFFIVSEFGMKNVERTAVKTIRTIGATLLLAFILIIFVIYILVNRIIINPISVLSASIDRISQGDFSQGTESKNNDELGTLYRGINLMALKLSKYNQDLKNEVKKATLEVENKNNELNDKQKALLNILDDVDAERKIIIKKEAEEIAVLDSIGDGVVATDMDGKVIYVNNEIEKMLGYPKEEIVGIKWSLKIPEVVDKNGNQIGFEAHSTMQALNEKKKIKTDYYYKTKNGETLPVSVVTTPVLIEKILKGAVVVVHDVSKERALEKMKDEFVSVASHELRTPMTAIKGFTSMILEGDYGKVPDKIVEPIKDISFSANRLIHLVNDMLNLSRIEAGRLKYALNEIDPLDVVAKVVNSLSPIAKQKNLVLEIGKTEKGTVSADSDKISQVLNNLVGNSLKFTEKGTIEIDTKRDKDHYVIFVKDTGIGIAKEDHKKVFRKFEQVTSVQAGKPEGTGLGLYISRQIAVKMGGEIWLEKSELGKGSVFGFSIPLAGSVPAKMAREEIEKDAKSHPDQKELS